MACWRLSIPLQAHLIPSRRPQKFSQEERKLQPERRLHAELCL